MQPASSRSRQKLAGLVRFSVEFPAGYHTNTRTDLEAFLPSGRGHTVLELGCGEGKTGAWLKSTGFAKRVVGVEQHPASAVSARTRLDEVYVADLDKFELPGEETFDVILAADVLEHLVEPAQVVERLLPRLRKGGWFVTSTPNVRFWRVLVDLILHAKWEYGSNVVLDPTHIRFFTKTSIQTFHRSLGLSVERFGHLGLSGRRELVDTMTFGSVRDFLCGQHVVRSAKQ